MSDFIRTPKRVIESLVSGPWKCDSCGQPIEEIEDGWVEWLKKYGEDRAYGLRLVHHVPASPFKESGGCQYEAQKEFQATGMSVRDLPMHRLLGSDGLMKLLELLSQKLLPEVEVVEMIKRLHIKDYEHTREFFGAAIADGIIEPNMSPSFYHANQIEAVKNWIDSWEPDEE